tara:strand:- start:203 stop:1312 length:1110 start_codon:yes stop_codon:yes gene_type:complete
MNILHITEELSKKNYSISSLVIFLCKYIENKKKIKHIILATKLQSSIFNDSSKIILVKENYFSNICKINFKIKNLIEKSDVVHIHGVWKWINFIGFYYCIRLSIPFFIHTHGMLLENALKNKNIFNYLIKIFFLKIYKLMSTKKINFISITPKESKSIYKHFKNAIVHLIPNPVPIDVKNKNVKLNNNFVYFGRIHPIKNLFLMIEAFDRANLPDLWKLNIYGIKDDSDYYKKIVDLIKTKRNIFIKKPIFLKEKLKILSTSWVNLLLSKSEVLSISVLESAALGLPSLVNKDIQINRFRPNGGVITNTDIKSVVKNVITISKWSTASRNKRGKQLNKFINKHYSIKVISIRYLELYDSLLKLKKSIRH